jgi:DNA-binding response OmpR family regulator
MQILLVEDDILLADGLRQALKREGFAVNHVDKGNDALHVVKTEPPDIVVLDLGLPDIDGLTVLRKLREVNKKLSVLLLTARDSTKDIVSGLDSGADDYLAKPFDISELLARLRVLERRQGTNQSSEICIGPVCLDTATHNVSFDGSPAEFSRREYMLLKALMENAGKIQTRDSLETKLYSWGEEVSSNAIEVHIHHLRKKLPTDMIKTVRGVGYTVSRK